MFGLAIGLGLSRESEKMNGAPESKTSQVCSEAANTFRLHDGLMAPKNQTEQKEDKYKSVDHLSQDRFGQGAMDLMRGNGIKNETDCR